MCSNQLKLNEDKTEAILFSSHSSCLLIAYRSQSLLVLSKLHSLTKLGSWGSSPTILTMKQHVIKVCQTAYYELKRINQEKN